MRIRGRRSIAKVNLKWKNYEVLREDRLRRHMESVSIEEVVADILNECVDTACEFAEQRRKRKKVVIKKEKGVKDERMIKIKEKGVKDKKKIEKGRPRKRQLSNFTWHERSCIIFMLLHKGIFNGDVYKASEKLGIPRTTLLT